MLINNAKTRTSSLDKLQSLLSTIYSSPQVRVTHSPSVAKPFGTMMGLMERCLPLLSIIFIFFPLNVKSNVNPHDLFSSLPGNSNLDGVLSPLKTTTNKLPTRTQDDARTGIKQGGFGQVA